MSKQSDIQEGIDNILFGGHTLLIPGYTPKAIRSQILEYLHSQDVVIKKRYCGKSHEGTWQKVFTVEPLIEGDQ